MSDFHSRIMNLQPDYAKPNAHAVVYKRGFRDARHVAAEVGLEADALLVRLAEQETKAEWAQHWKDKHDALAARLAEAVAAVQAFADHFGPLEDNHMLNDECRHCFALARGVLGTADSAPAVPAHGGRPMTLREVMGAEDSADPVIHAQHDETGRMWTGPRSQLPRRYAEVSAEDAPERCLDCGKTIDLCGCAL